MRNTLAQSRTFQDVLKTPGCLLSSNFFFFRLKISFLIFLCSTALSFFFSYSVCIFCYSGFVFQNHSPSNSSFCSCFSLSSPRFPLPTSTLSPFIEKEILRRGIRVPWTAAEHPLTVGTSRRLWAHPQHLFHCPATLLAYPMVGGGRCCVGQHRCQRLQENNLKITVIHWVRSGCTIMLIFTYFWFKLNDDRL